MHLNVQKLTLTETQLYYDKANGAGPEVNYNKGILNVRDGKYADAVTNFGEYKGFNKALAELLNGNQGSVNTTIDATSEKDMAISSYLKAVAAARNNNAAEVINNLKAAIEKDGSLKAAAKDDAEFIKLRENADFKGLTKRLNQMVEPFFMLKNCILCLKSIIFKNDNDSIHHG